MRLQLERREWAAAGIATLGLLAAYAIASAFWGRAAIAIVVILGFGLVFVALGELYRRQVQHHEARREDYRQVEALFSLFALLKPNAPLPPMREWACSPDLLTTILEQINFHRPGQVLELGSGVSTLVAAYGLKQRGSGRLLALEHDPLHVVITEQRLANHQLNDLAQVTHAPLETIAVGGRQRAWYATDALAQLDAIDLLIIDGPPGIVGELARYPALPLLYDRLSDEAVIIMDDGQRDEEQLIVALWLEQFDDLTAESLPSEKGTVILRRLGTRE